MNAISSPCSIHLVIDITISKAFIDQGTVELSDNIIETDCTLHLMMLTGKAGETSNTVLSSVVRNVVAASL